LSVIESQLSIPQLVALLAELGQAVAYLVEAYATSRKVASSIPDEVIGFFIDLNLPGALWP
jgi:hypothetical protein